MASDTAKKVEELKGEVVMLTEKISDLLEQNESFQRDAYHHALIAAEMNENFIKMSSFIVQLFEMVSNNINKKEILLCEKPDLLQ